MCGGAAAMGLSPRGLFGGDGAVSEGILCCLVQGLSPGLLPLCWRLPPLQLGVEPSLFPHHLDFFPKVVTSGSGWSPGDPSPVVTAPDPPQHPSPSPNPCAIGL